MEADQQGVDWNSVAVTARQEVENAIGELREILGRYDPVEIVSRVATFVLVSLPGEHKDAGGPIKSETNLEYLVSMVTALPFPELPKFPDPDVILRVLELTTQILMRATVHYSANAQIRKNEHSPIDELADSFRTTKLHVRGDGYWPHLRDTMADLLLPHELKLREVLGFGYRDYVNFMDRVEEEINERFFKEADDLGRAYRQWMSPWDLKDRNVIGSDSFVAFISANSKEIEAAKSDYDRIGGPSIYAMIPQTLEECSILEALKTQIGENEKFLGVKPEHAFWPLTSSSTDSRPILFSNGVHYAFNIQKLQREAHVLVGDLLRERDELYWKGKFLRDRDDYLDRECSRLFQSAFPQAQVLRRVLYPDNAGNETEADVLFVADGILMVVECKAGRLDASSWRGGEKRLAKDMKETVACALNQAERFVTELVRRGSMVVQSDDHTSLRISADQFSRIFSVSVTLELVSCASMTLWELRDAGLIADTSRSWSVNLNDLRVILEILDRPDLFFHYLVRRLDTNSLRTVEAGDELDYLMHYVEKGLFFREANSPGNSEQIMIGNWTDPLDQYYRRVQEGSARRRDKPRVCLGKQTERVMNILSRQKPTGWLLGCIEILEFDVPVREELFGKLSKHLEILMRNDSPFAFSFVANFESATGIAVVTSRAPARVRNLVIARAEQHCKDHKIGCLWVFLFGVPLSTATCEVLKVGSSIASGPEDPLLAQLRFETLEFRLRDRCGKNCENDDEQNQPPES